MRSASLTLLMLICLVLPARCSDDNQPEVADDYDRRAAAEPTEAPVKTQRGNQTPVRPKQPPVAASTAGQLNQTLRGTVEETMDAAGYTYMRVKTDRESIWAAARAMKVAVGDTVELVGAMPMRDFHSKTLNRTFKTILFVGGATVIGGEKAAPPADRAQGLPPGHPPLSDAPTAGKSKPTPPVGIRPGEIEKLEDGRTVAELFEHKADLNGKPVRLRARVVKASRGIMGKNWLHLRDGTGETGQNDVTVTSVEGYAAPGAVVIAEGMLGVDKDIGAGYFFPVIIEDAKIIIETEP